jgi:hypothetical protein
MDQHNYNSTCISTKHQEFDCMTKYGVSSKKFTAIQWCEPCKLKYKQYIDDGKVIYGEPKQRGKRKTAEKP